MGILATATGLLLNSPAPLINPKVALSRSHPLLKATKRTGGKLVKVLLTADIEGLGKEGTIVEVKPAYAENFILAKRLGSKASQQMIDRAGISVQAADISIPDLAELGSAVAELQLHPSIATDVKVTLIKSKITFS